MAGAMRSQHLLKRAVELLRKVIAPASIIIRNTRTRELFLCVGVVYYVGREK